MGSVFHNKDVQPDDAMIHTALASNPEAWDQVTSLLADAGVTVSWRHYRDGGWLAKATLKNKTIAWLAVEDGFVRVTFHFAERHRTQLSELHELPTDIRQGIAQTPLSGKLLPVTFEVRGGADIPLVATMLQRKRAAR